MNRPWITIAIPAYNRASLLQQTIDSVRQQTDVAWELYIVDDQSSDKSWAIAKEAADRDSRITVQRNSENRGLAGNFSYCGRLGSAPYQLLLAADDQLEGDFLKRLHDAADRDPTLGLLCGRRVLSVAKSNRYRPYAVVYQGRQNTGSTVARALRNGNLYGLYSAVVARRDALQAIGGIRTDNPWAGDFEAFVQIAARYPLYFEPSALVYQHIDSSTQTSEMLGNGTIIRYEIETLQRLLMDVAVQRFLTHADIQGAWERIQALAWSIQLYQRWIAKTPAVGLEDSFRDSTRPWSTIPTLVRLLYHRWRLTY